MKKTNFEKIFGAKKFIPKKRSKAFTLVEVMIALLVFGVGVVSVLGMVVYNISLSDNIKTQVSGTLLAKEGIEMIYNMKETNKKKDFAWNVMSVDGDDANGYNPVFSFSSGDRAIVGVSFSENENSKQGFGRYSIQKLSGNPGESEFEEKIKLYIHSGENNLSGYYNHIKDNGQPSNFSRYIEFGKVNNVDGETEDNFDKIAKITSHVFTNKGRKKEIKIETFIGNN